MPLKAYLLDNTQQFTKPVFDPILLQMAPNESDCQYLSYCITPGRLRDLPLGKAAGLAARKGFSNSLFDHS